MIEKQRQTKETDIQLQLGIGDAAAISASKIDSGIPFF